MIIQNTIIDKSVNIDIPGLDRIINKEFSIYLTNHYIDRVKSRMKSNLNIWNFSRLYINRSRYSTYLNTISSLLDIKSDEGKLINDLTFMISNKIFINYEDSKLTRLSGATVDTIKIVKLLEYGSLNLKPYPVFRDEWDKVFDQDNIDKILGEYLINDTPDEYLLKLKEETSRRIKDNKISRLNNVIRKYVK